MTLHERILCTLTVERCVRVYRIATLLDETRDPVLRAMYELLTNRPALVMWVGRSQWKLTDIGDARAKYLVRRHQRAVAGGRP